MRKVQNHIKFPLQLGTMSDKPDSDENVPSLLNHDGTPISASVLIPTINNGEELGKVLDCLSKQTYPHFEVYCIDSKSKDNTKEVVQKYGAIWIDDDSRNRADACNYGIKKINTDVILFTDDDTLPPTNWVESLLRWFSREEVGGVGGPNFAPTDSPFGGKIADVAFCAKWVTAGTRYGKSPQGELIEIDHNPGCNSAYRTNILKEIGGFEEGCIGAEDVVLDKKITNAGYRLWFDPTAIMPHRRRKPISPYMKQLRNYGYVRTLANSRWPALKSWSHIMIGLFPLLATIGALAVISNQFIENDFLNLISNISSGLIAFYIFICLFGGALGSSPHRNFSTVLMAPLMVFLAHWSYGSGVVRGWMQIYIGEGAAAGLGIQIDDKKRTV